MKTIMLAIFSTVMCWTGFVAAQPQSGKLYDPQCMAVLEPALSKLNMNIDSLKDGSNRAHFLNNYKDTKTMEQILRNCQHDYPDSHIVKGYCGSFCCDKHNCKDSLCFFCSCCR